MYREDNNSVGFVRVLLRILLFVLIFILVIKLIVFLFNRSKKTNVDQSMDTNLTVLKDAGIKVVKEDTFNLKTGETVKYKLQDLLNKKNEIHKYIIQLEHKKDKNMIDIEKKININNSNNNSISQELSNFQSNIYINRKRKRRKKSQISCNFECYICKKKYATEGALNQHYKLKHKN